MDTEEISTQEMPSPRHGTLPVLVGTLVGTLALLAYLFAGARNETAEVQKLLTTKVEQFALVQLRLDSIAKALDIKIAEVRRLGGNVLELERIRRQLDADTKKLKYDLRFSEQQYQLKISDYEQVLLDSENDLQRLRAENTTLLGQARQLEAEKQRILTQNEGLRREKEALAQTIVDYSRQNKELKDQVTRASALKAVNVEIRTLAHNGRERRGGIYKAARIDRLKITFSLPANPLASRGPKDIYLRLLDPNGAVLSDSGIGGVLRADGRELGYTYRQTVMLEDNDQSVSLIFHLEAPYTPGLYTVELYAEGYRIGEGQFKVK